MHRLISSTVTRHIGVMLVVVILVLSLSLAACTGPPGTQGPPGELAAQPEAALTVIVASEEDVTVAGSGFCPGESINLTVIGKAGAGWGVGTPWGFEANESGAFAVKLTSRQLSRLSTVLIEDVLIYTMKATGSEGSVATAPLIWD